jgi:hypothetical protein
MVSLTRGFYVEVVWNEAKWGGGDYAMEKKVRLLMRVFSLSVAGTEKWLCWQQHCPD